MSDFRIFFVATSSSKPGKGSQGAQWMREKGQAFFESFAGVKSLQVFATQFGLGQALDLEFWFEIEDYAVMDRWDADMAANPQNYSLYGEYTDLFDSGPSRIMGDWPESRILE